MLTEALIGGGAASNLLKNQSRSIKLLEVLF